MQKILKVIGKIVAGLFIFYLAVSWIILPLAGPLVIASQAKKILQTPVNVKAVLFNPFLWRLTIKKLTVEDADKQTIVGWDKFQVDVSFLSLFKKTYRIESILLDGLHINAALLSDGKINLLKLIPQPTPTPPKQTSETPTEKPAMPLVIVDDIALTNGKVTFTDQSVQPNFHTTLGAINIHVTGLTTRPDCRLKITLQSKLDNKGVISSDTVLDPFVQPLALETSFTLDQYAMMILTPYVGKYTGRQLADGTLLLKMDYKIADNQITASHKLLIQRFTFGEKVESKDALKLPFGLVVALLEDPQGRINISLPVKGNLNDPQFKYLHSLGDVARNFIIKLATKPFTFLASIIGSESGTEEFGTIKFLPGQADLTPEESEKLKLLAKGLSERPKLKLEINGTYDPDTDWKMMKAKIFNQDYDQLKPESTKGEIWIYQQLYQRQFGVRELWALTKSYRNQDGSYNEQALQEAIKKAIIDHGQADKSALEALAQARAKVIEEALLADGFDAKRLTVGGIKTTQASMGNIPLEFTLTIYEGEPQNGI